MPTGFYKYSAVRLSNKFVTKSSMKMPPHIKAVAKIYTFPNIWQLSDSTVAMGLVFGTILYAFKEQVSFTPMQHINVTAIRTYHSDPCS